MSRRLPPSAAATDLFIALGAVVKRLRHNPLPNDEALREAMTGMAPAPRHIAALMQVASEDRLGMGELAERLSVSLATASQVVSDLADWGLVERVTDASDRRRTYVLIAPAHQTTIRALLDSRLGPMERTLQRLEPDERSALLRALTVLAEELDHMKETAR